MRELEDDTCRLCPKNVHGEGDYGIAYYGVLIEDTKVAVKNLLNNKYVFFQIMFYFCVVEFDMNLVLTS